mmetsp:Transcript_37573/g.94227  ORF Transcript_37573/g.94227 Transcript_37573/m.94227 type:complete len:85 (-) Transcript_37573:2660-2914(-)
MIAKRILFQKNLNKYFSQKKSFLFFCMNYLTQIKMKFYLDLYNRFQILVELNVHPKFGPNNHKILLYLPTFSSIFSVNTLFRQF